MLREIKSQKLLLFFTFQEIFYVILLWNSWTMQYLEMTQMLGISFVTILVFTKKYCNIQIYWVFPEFVFRKNEIRKSFNFRVLEQGRPASDCVCWHFLISGPVVTKKQTIRRLVFSFIAKLDRNEGAARRKDVQVWTIWHWSGIIALPHLPRPGSCYWQALLYSALLILEQELLRSLLCLWYITWQCALRYI